LLLFDEAFNLPCVVLRYFNVYGPRQPQVGAYALVMGIFYSVGRKVKSYKFMATVNSVVILFRSMMLLQPILQRLKVSCGTKFLILAVATIFLSKNWRT